MFIYYKIKDNSKKPSSFYTKFIPDMIMKLYIRNMGRIRLHKSNVSEYIEKEYGVTLGDVVSSLRDNINVTKNKGGYVYTIDSNCMIGKHKYIEVFSTLESGNLKVKGMGLIGSVKSDLFRNNFYWQIYLSRMFIRKVRQPCQ